MKHYPRKRFGQNFLQNQSIINQILSAANLQENDKVIEIGPGLGALTQPLLRQLNHLTAIEIDRDLQQHLLELPSATNKLTLVATDALTVDYSQWGPQLRVLGNLPYNIATTLLLYLLKFMDYIDDMHFMLQKEVALRLAAKPGSKAYGRLSVMVQYHCEVEHLFDVPPEAFYPRPKVDSAIIRLIPYKESPYPPVDLKSLESLLVQAFSMRRKTLANNLKSMLSITQLSELGIDPISRPEQISVANYVQLAKFITS
jgi:16S rRNA (adenine1518-N6/adenine1519-N6)-dimethyltransferase